jgi:uncharacterized protein YbjT (DUF2867 family)
MDTKKTIVVVGATGAQGGGLVQAILNDNAHEFNVRAITRNINSDKAKELLKQGAEVVAADLDDIESLKKAFQGAYGAYCVTFFWNHFSPEKEKENARALAEAAKYAGIKHVIWSTLDDTRHWIPLNDNRMPTLLGKYKVPHFDAKGEANHFFTDLGLPVTFLNTVFYWDNFIYFGLGPKKGQDGKLSISIPMGDKKLPGIVAADIGKCALGIFKANQKYIGKTIGIAGEHLTIKEIAETFSQVLNKEVIYNSIEPEVYRSFGFPGAEDMGNMFQFKRDFEQEYCKSRDLELTRLLNPTVRSFKDWLIQNKDLIPQE